MRAIYKNSNMVIPMIELGSKKRPRHQHRSAEAVPLDVEVLQPKDSGFRQPRPDEVKAVLTHASWTQAEAARQLGVNVSTIRRWHTPIEGRDYIPIPYATWRLALILGGLVQLPGQESHSDGN